MKVVMIQGKAGSGKDTFFGLAKSKFDNLHKVALADPLRRICKQIYPDDFTDRTKKEEPKKYREIMIEVGQYLGAEPCSVQYWHTVLDGCFTPNKHFWCDLAWKKIQQIELENKGKENVYMITDWRMLKEYYYFKTLLDIPIITIKIDREIKDSHSFRSNRTETELDDHKHLIQHIVVNDGGIDSYENTVSDVMRHILK
ncbi:MAG: hypothetical protein GY679_02120 [Mycoplasma sp.]|nr:hypothetical protein [Mycoplasma sp.]